MNTQKLYSKFIKNLSDKKLFLILVFGNLILQVLIAFIILLIAENYDIINNKYQLITMFFLLFFLVIIMSFIKNTFIRFIIFCVFSSLIGLIFSYKFDKNDSEQVEIYKKAFITTIGIFIFMVLYAFFLIYLGVKIPPSIGIGLFLALLIIIIITFILSITGKYPIYYKFISGAVIFIFSLFIAYDTIIVMDRNYSGIFVGASLDYFIDILNIFSSFNNIM